MPTMPHRPSMSEVAYSGVVQIPLCIGSVAVPLQGFEPQLSSQGRSSITVQEGTTRLNTTPLRRGGTGGGGGNGAAASHRCTHRRYCYVRDGAALSQDGFYRWLLHQTRTSSTVITNTDEYQDREAGTETEVRSPSLLYSMIDHVIFTLPKGFANTRRVLRETPFVIADDTWARHLVEVQIFFLSELGIAPVTLVHHVLLNYLAEVPPRLLAQQFGQPKPPLFLAQPPVTTEPTAELDWLVVVSERKDSVRLMHPSLLVLTFVRRVLAKANAPVVQALWEYYAAHVAPHEHLVGDDKSRPVTVLSCSGAPDLIDSAWQLPYEPFIHRHSLRRTTRAREALRTVLAALREEQDELWDKNELAVEEMRTTVGKLHACLDAMRSTCVRLAGDDA